MCTTYDTDDSGGLFSASLGMTETSVFDSAGVDDVAEPEWTPGDYLISPPELHEAERAFRHSCWAPDRRRVAAALAKRLKGVAMERFMQCGSGAVVEYSPSLCKARTRAHFCRNRWCLPCAKARAYLDELKLRELVRGKVLRRVTLTVKSYRGEKLITALGRLERAWDILRKDEWFRSKVTGGVKTLEVKRGKLSGNWHPHIHLLLEGDFVKQQTLSGLWEQITEDSNNVYCELLRQGEQGEEQAVQYGTKYACKPVPEAIYRNPSDLLEAMDVLKGKRMFDYIGTWRKAKKPEPVRANDWQRVDRLHRLATRARYGCRESRLWLQLIAESRLELLLSHAEPEWAVRWYQPLGTAPPDDPLPEPDVQPEPYVFAWDQHRTWIYDGLAFRI